MNDTPRTDNYDWSFHLLFAEAQKMERELNAANERIKRLEEAGDRMFRMLEHDGFESVGQNMWKQAKEAKP